VFAPYPKDFRRAAVELLYRSGKTIAQPASELDVSPQRHVAGTSARQRAFRACLSRMLGNGHVRFWGAGRSNAPAYPA
jgi:hypothetical protein